MAELVTLMEPHSDRQPPTVVIEATTWRETVLAGVKLTECGLGVNLPVNVCCDYPACVHLCNGILTKSWICLCKLLEDPSLCTCVVHNKYNLGLVQ